MPPGCTRWGVALAALLAVASLAAEADPDRRPQAGARILLDAALEAPTTVVGTVVEGTALDERSWLAFLVVETSLSGDHATGARIPFAWEELSQGRPPRFVDGGSVLIVLEPLPSWSIWRERLAGREALGVARRGEAWLSDPDPRTLAILGRLLARPPAERSGAEALPELAELVAYGASPLALAALDRIARTPGLGHRLGEEPRESLRRALLEEDRPPALRAAIAGLVGERGLEEFRPELEALMAPGSSLAPDAIGAWAALPGGLERGRAEVLLARPEPAVRAVALRHAPPDLPDAILEARLREDPAPEVRAEAVHALVGRRGMGAYPLVEGLLSDPNTLDGAAAIRALGALGAPAVPTLAARVNASELDGARGPLLALSVSGGAGVPALREIAARHPDAAVRGFARFLLGRGPEGH